MPLKSREKYWSMEALSGDALYVETSDLSMGRWFVEFLPTLQGVIEEGGEFLQRFGIAMEDIKLENPPTFLNACFVLLLYHLRSHLKENKKFQTYIEVIFNHKNVAEKMLGVPKVAMQTMEDFIKFLTDSKVSGIAVEKIIKVHFVGNTTSGKSSVIRTIKAGESNMTGEDPDLLETKVIDVYKNLSLGTETTHTLNITTLKSGRKMAKLSKASSETSPGDTQGHASITFFDTGGHQQYSLFNESVITNGSVIVICFDATQYDYATCICPYFDLIFTTGKSLAVLLVATHCHEDIGVSVDEKELIDMAECHCKGRFKSIEARKLMNKPVFIPTLFKVSNKTYEGIDDFKDGLLAICLSDELLPMASRYPILWNEFKKEMKDKMVDGTLSLEQSIQIFANLLGKKGIEANTSLTTKQLELINEIQNIAQGIFDKSLNFEIGEDGTNFEDTDSEGEDVLGLERMELLDKVPDAHTSLWEVVLHKLPNDGERGIKCFKHSGNVKGENASNTTALDHLRDTGSILRFGDKLYPDVDLVFNSVRFVIRHDIKEQLKRANLNLNLVSIHFDLEKELQDVYGLGHVSFNILRLLYDVHQKKEKKKKITLMKMDHTVSIMEEMGIVYKTKEEDGKYWLFIPSLIQDTIQELECKSLNFCLTSVQEQARMVEVTYHFNMGSGSMNVVNLFLVKLCSSNKNVNMLKTFSEQIENRKPGVVSFAFMTIENQEIFVKEEEIVEETEKFYRTRSITTIFKVHEKSTDIKEVITLVDDILQSVIDMTKQRAWSKRVTCPCCRAELDFEPKYLILPTSQSLGMFDRTGKSITSWETDLRCSNTEKLHKKTSPMMEKEETTLTEMKLSNEITVASGDVQIGHAIIQNLHIHADKVVLNLHQELQGRIDPDFYKTYVEEITETTRLQQLSKLSNRTGGGLPIPKLFTIHHSICLVLIPGRADGTAVLIPGQAVGTAFLAKVKGVSGIVLFSAGHNFYEEVQKGCKDVNMNGTCEGKSGCSVHGFYSLDYSKYQLIFNNIEGITTTTSSSNASSLPTSLSNAPSPPTSSSNTSNPLTSSSSASNPPTSSSNASNPPTSSSNASSPPTASNNTSNPPTASSNTSNPSNSSSQACSPPSSSSNASNPPNSSSNASNPPTSSSNKSSPPAPTSSSNPSNPPTPPTDMTKPIHFNMKDLMSKFQKCTLLMASCNSKREDKIGLNPSHKCDMSARNKYEDYFTKIMHDDINETAEEKLKNLGLTFLAEVGEGSSLEQNSENALSIFGHPFVKEEYKQNKCVPLRFSFGNERHEKDLKKRLGKAWKGSNQKSRRSERIFYAYDTLPGNSGSPVLSRQEVEPYYFIKGIHVAGEEIKGVITNEAQKLTNIIQDLKNAK